ncbi:hypothetical protein BCR44DRAFT_1442897, partial [Catenaria anguillulae PL171]
MGLSRKARHLTPSPAVSLLWPSRPGHSPQVPAPNAERTLHFVNSTAPVAMDHPRVVKGWLSLIGKHRARCRMGQLCFVHGLCR